MLEKTYRPYLDWIQGQRTPMLDLLEIWANINSHTDNIPGLETMLSALKTAFSSLGGVMQEIPLQPRVQINANGETATQPVGKALRIKKYPHAPIQILLGGHYDTVYPLDHSFQAVFRPKDELLQGPGVADMKGGLIVLLKALETLERSPFAGKIGWEVLINPDEEVGSPSSESLFIEAAKRNHIGLLYEPSFADGAIVSSRKGSANMTLVVKGKAAHAGRDFFSGRNALTAAMRFALDAESLTNKEKGITVNIGNITGGGPVNIVPDLAICHFNIRMSNPEDLLSLTKALQERAVECNSAEGFSAQLFENSARAPKPFDEKNQALFQKIASCGNEIDISLQTRPSGGVCDGNILSEHGLPTIDTLGAVGGYIHTNQEYILINSLVERSLLSAYFLMKIANGEIQL